MEKSIVPSHIAVIMDGNGRWAKARGWDRSAGHVEGVNAVRRVTEAASKAGVKYLTLYTFSTENWNRPQTEVDMLMHLVVTAIERETPDLIRNNVSLRMIGDFDRMPRFAYDKLMRSCADTAHCTGLVLTLAISYSSRWEITDAARKLAVAAVEGTLDPAKLTDEDVSNALATSDLPDPDLLIRTGGEKRISNFLLWQAAYSEIYFTDTYWPDFGEEALLKAIDEYGRRERRYGLTSEQLTQVSPANP